MGDIITVTPKPNAGYKYKEGSLKIVETNEVISNNQFIITSMEKVIIGEGKYIASNYDNSSYITEGNGYLQFSLSSTANRACTSIETYDYSLYDKLYIEFSGYALKSGSTSKRAANIQIYLADKNLYQIINPESTCTECIYLSSEYIRTTEFDISSLTDSGTFKVAHHGGSDYYSGTQNLVVYEAKLIASNANFTITAEFEPIDVNYIVNHYIEQLDGSYKLYSSETKQGTIGSEINLSSILKDIKGFLFQIFMN